MNDVFEDFVVTALREALGLSDRVFRQASKGRNLFLDASQQVRLEPDLSWWDGPGAVLLVMPSTRGYWPPE